MTDVPKPRRIRPAVLAQAIAQFKTTQPPGLAEGTAKPADIFTPAQPPRGVLPEGVTPQMAMDYAGPWDDAYAYATGGDGLFHEGLRFLGYPYLAELTQRPEYRRPVEIIARDMTRHWIKIKGDDAKARKIARIEKALKHFKVQDTFRAAVQLDGFFGRGHIYIDTGDTEKPEVLESPLTIDARCIPRKGLKGLVLIEPVWTYPYDYNSSNPLSEKYYKPQSWYVMGTRVHRSRLLTFVSRPVPDILKPSYSFGGLALSQIAKPYVDNWLRTRQSVSDLLHSFSKDVLKTNMGDVLQEGGADNLINRLTLFVATRDNRGVTALDMDTEDLVNIATPLSGLSDLQAQSQEQMASVVGIPLVILLGITPSGLNASSDGEIKTYYAAIHALQELLFNTPLNAILGIIQLHLFGAIDPDITFEYVPLWEDDSTTAATNRKTDADADVALIGAGVLDAADSRNRLARDETGPYHGMSLLEPAAPPEDDETDDVPHDTDPPNDADQGERPPA